MFPCFQSLIKDRVLGSDEDKSSLEASRKAELSKIHFQFTLALLWAFTAMLNAPSLMAYARNLPHGIAQVNKRTISRDSTSFNVYLALP